MIATLTYTGTPGTPVYYHNDWHGSPMAATQGGKVTAKYAYGPFGEHSAAAGAPKQFTGQRYDYETSIYYLHARTYDPAQGRFFSFDPIGLKGGNNLYAYVNNDPINHTDSTGLAAAQIASAASNLLSCASPCLANEGEGTLNSLQNLGSFAYNNPGTTLAIAGMAVPGLGEAEGVGVVVNEARAIVTSPQMASLAQAYANGESMAVNIGGRMIQYEPGLPASGMTMFGENGFLIGPEAFQSNLEHNATVLHELYRLTFSQSAGGVSGGLATSETQAAFNFANQFARSLP